MPQRETVETEELKINHVSSINVSNRRLKSQLSIVDSQDWEDILRPTATYLQTSDEAFLKW